MKDALSFIDRESDTIEKAESVLAFCVAFLAKGQSDDDLRILLEFVRVQIPDTHGGDRMFHAPQSWITPDQSELEGICAKVVDEYIDPMLDIARRDLVLFGFASALFWIHKNVPIGDQDRDIVERVLMKIRGKIS